MLLINRDALMPQVLYAVAFSHWKRARIRAFLPESRIHFVDKQRDAPAGATVLLWGAQAARSVDQDIIRVEDGFLRSVGLGADLIAPLSCCFDRSGLYYDATQPSDLETLLQHHEFTPQLLALAGRLRERIVALGLTKYNVGAAGWQRPDTAREVILVPGQVESDASIALGCTGVRGNMALLQAVRASHPDAYIVYKAHPDVLAGLRRQGQGEADAGVYCDEQVSDVSMHALLDGVDSVHVLTSAAGFEALLRNKAVTCHGSPFYAGWGLTTDMHTLPRRQRRLSLDALVAGTLILYPRYVHPGSGQRCTAEEAVNALSALRQGHTYHTPLWRKAFRVALRQVVGVR